MKNYFCTHKETETEKILALLEEEDQKHQIILYNDDINTFDWVIECLVNICHHTPVQAEQCAFIVHHNGKCDVKSGNYEDLEPLCSALLSRGLSAEIV